jgi:hypothetical protein
MSLKRMVELVVDILSILLRSLDDFLGFLFSIVVDIWNINRNQIIYFKYSKAGIINEIIKKKFLLY